MKQDDLANCMRMEVSRSIGEAMVRTAKYEMEMTIPEMLEALNFIDFAKLYDFRVKTLSGFNNPDVVRTVRFTSSDRNEKEINFKLDKRVGRIDFVNLGKSEVTIKDLLEIVYLHPEANVLLQSHINKQEQYNFDQCKIDTKGRSGIGYYSRDKAGISDVSCLAQTDKKGIITQFGNKGRVLTQLLFEFGKYLGISCYSMTKPRSKEEKAYYEVGIMSAYNRKI